jgi:hypothetical protein
MPELNERNHQDDRSFLTAAAARRGLICFLITAVAFAVLTVCAVSSLAQAPSNAAASASESSAQTEEIRELREAVRELRAEVAELRSEVRKNQVADENAPKLTAASLQTQTTTPPPAAATAEPQHEAGLDFLRETTMEVGVDGYYAWNFNDPIGRVNLLRAYDVLSNAFSLNQASLILKEDPDVSAGRRFGARLDLQWGQATETLQGNPVNEPRPDVYRNIFQAYGTYVAPIGSGLNIDFGKWASSLGVEGNYTKDQMNYSRSYWFNFLPFYHMGLRTSYKLLPELTVNYWVVNGTDQTEPFNGYKDELFGFVAQPHKTLTWTMNYYLGQEHPDVVFFPNGGAPPNSPTEQGLPFQPIPDAPNGKLHILDTYATWQTTPKLTLAAEGDYVIERLLPESAPSHTDGGAAYFRYQLTGKTALAARGEYLSDRGGLFSGLSQALKEATLTYDYKLAEGFLVRTEWRRDFSNRPFFLTDQLGILSNHQTTATLGLTWWWGNKEGAW